MTSALVAFTCKATPTDEQKSKLSHTSLSNAKQILIGVWRKDITGTTGADLNAGIVKLSALPGVTGARVLSLVNS